MKLTIDGITVTIAAPVADEPNVDNLTSVIAAVVAQHPDHMDGMCCGGTDVPAGGFDTQDQWARHVARHVANTLITAGCRMPYAVGVDTLRTLYQPTDAEPVVSVAPTPSGYKPYRCTECYTTGHTKVGRCVNGHDVDTSPAAAVNYLKIGSSDQGAPPWIAAVQGEPPWIAAEPPAPTPAPTIDDLKCNGVMCGECVRVCRTGYPPAPTPAPVVELDADELQSLASLAQSYSGLRGKVGDLVVNIGGIKAVIVRTGYTVRVRIGGEQ